MTYPPPLYSITPLHGLPHPKMLEEKMRSATLHIEGMSCGHCLNAVNQALAAVPGVEIEAVQIGRAEVRYDERTTDPAKLEAVVAEAGYQAAAAG